jgi:hypothetical protein
MSFKIIDGGQSDPPKNPVNKIEQLRLFVSHMRALERTIASIKTVANKMKWTELDKRLTSCHDQILDTLVYVKKTTKDKKVSMNTKPSKKHLKIITLEDET